jgi:hypothetical protein
MQQAVDGHPCPSGVLRRYHPLFGGTRLTLNLALGAARVQFRRTAIAGFPLARRCLVFFARNRAFCNQATAATQRHFLNRCAIGERFFRICRLTLDIDVLDQRAGCGGTAWLQSQDNRLVATPFALSRLRSMQNSQKRILSQKDSSDDG